MSKLTANEIIVDKFWIISNGDNKIGTLKQTQSEFLYYENSTGTSRTIDKEYVDNNFEFKSKITDSSYQTTLFGYPIPDIAIFNTTTKDQLPVFKKRADGKIYHAAGYYAIEYPTIGWTNSFCPKVSTLKKYNWHGPFRSETDMNIMIARTTRNLK